MNVNELLQLMVKKGISDIHFKMGQRRYCALTANHNSGARCVQCQKH